MKTICRILILALLHLCWLTSYGWAEMVTTESTVQSQTQSSILTDRQRLLGLLQREDIQTKLIKYGISQEEATARINSMTDEETMRIAGKLNQLSAGGHNIIEEAASDALSDIFYEIFFWTALIGFVAVSYFVGVLVKSVACPFQERCQVFRPWWDWDSDPGYPTNVPAQPYYPPPEPRPESSPETPLADEPVVDNGVYTPGAECDARVQACEWSVR